MKVNTCPLEGILLLEPAVYADARGFFLESYERSRYSDVGITQDFPQDNHSRSSRNVLRGMHFTKNKPQAQILTVMRGTIFDVVVDIRRDSPTFGQWFGTALRDDGIRQIYMPHGFAHGFCVLSDYADLHYKVSQKFDPHDDAGLRWDDPDVAIDWPIKSPIISAKDRRHPLLRDLS